MNAKAVDIQARQAATRYRVLLNFRRGRNPVAHPMMLDAIAPADATGRELAQGSINRHSRHIESVNRVNFGKIKGNFGQVEVCEQCARYEVG